MRGVIGFPTVSPGLMVELEMRKMKPLKWPTRKEEHAYMFMRLEQNRASSQRNRNENQVASRLSKTARKWKRQAMWGYRIYDFWCHAIGIAIEVDGPEHDANYDAYRDEYNFRRSGIVVLRLDNGDMVRLEEILSLTDRLGTWKDRRILLGLNVHTRAGRRRLLKLPRYPSLLAKYLEEEIESQTERTMQYDIRNMVSSAD